VSPSTVTGSWADRPFLCIDTETTGLDPATDRVVEAAAVTLDRDGVATSSWVSIVDPGIDIPKEATAVHRITTQRARGEGISPELALHELAGRIWAHQGTNYQAPNPVVIYNAPYDWPLLLAEAARYGVEFPAWAPIVDPLLIDRMVSARAGSRRLVDVTGQYDIPVALEDATAAHGAMVDAIAAGQTLRQIAHQHPDLAHMTLGALFVEQVRFYEVDRERYADWVRRNRDPGYEGTPGWPIPITPPQARPPAAADRHGGAVGPRDLAILAGRVFHADSAMTKRLRYALTHAATSGQCTSANDLNGRQIHVVHEQLVDIGEGRTTYTVDADGVRFDFADATAVWVPWSALDRTAVAS
jgi:DNA polymerase-3 subunit epsilon